MKPEARIEMIRQSLRCFAFGLWSLVPVVGIVTAVCAVVTHRRVRKLAGGEWNPANKYLHWGVFLGWAKLLVVLAVIALSVIAVCLE